MADLRDLDFDTGKVFPQKDQFERKKSQYVYPDLLETVQIAIVGRRVQFRQDYRKQERCHSALTEIQVYLEGSGRRHRNILVSLATYLDNLGRTGLRNLPILVRSKAKN